MTETTTKEECSYCGKPIKSRETYYTFIREGVVYKLHPVCHKSWVEKNG